MIRRTFLAGAGALAFLVAAQQAANAMLFSGAGSGGGGGVTTLTLLNTSGSTQQIGYCTQIFGLAFKKGDIPAGQAPIFTTTSGATICPFSVTVQRATWLDGSLKHAGFILRTPVTIAGSASLPITVSSGGSWPSNSSRTTADYTAGGLDLNVFMTGIEALSGDWTSNLGQGITAANSDSYKYLDGDAGRMDVIRASARQSAANHGQIEGYWFVTALNNSAGALAGIRHYCRIAQPWDGVASPAPCSRTLSALKTRNSVTQIRDIVSEMPAAATFSWVSGTTFNCTQSYENGQLCRLTTTGTLPAGLSLNTSYFIRVLSGSQIAFTTDSRDVGSDTAALITPTTSGTGTHTVTVYPQIAHSGSIVTNEVDGRASYIQGNGSQAADSSLLVQRDAAYGCRTKTLPPYDIASYTADSNPTYTYNVATAGPVLRYLGQSGERLDIGILPAWHVRHIFTQALVDERAVRVLGLIMAHMNFCVRDFTTKSIPVCNNGVPGTGANYSGMPAKNTTYTGPTAPTNLNQQTQGWSGSDWSHMPGLAFYPYWLTAEPIYMQLVTEDANYSFFANYAGSGTAQANSTTCSIGAERNATINGTSRAGIFSGDNGTRLAAWKIRDTGAAAILPNTHPENASYAAYFNDIMTDTYGGLADYITMLTTYSSYITTNGIWAEAGDQLFGVTAVWMNGYYADAHAFYAGLSESSSALTMAGYVCKWPAHIYTTWGLWVIPYYKALIRTGGTDTWAYITSDAQFGIAGWTASWDGPTDVLTLTGAPADGYALANGDKFILNGNVQSPIPGGLAGFTPYYAVNVSGSTFKLATTPGGSAINLTDTGATVIFYGIPANVPGTSTIDQSDSALGTKYLANVIASGCYVNALGGTVDQPFLTAALAFQAASSGRVASFQNSPKYAFRKTYQ